MNDKFDNDMGIRLTYTARKYRTLKFARTGSKKPDQLRTGTVHHELRTNVYKHVSCHSASALFALLVRVLFAAVFRLMGQLNTFVTVIHSLIRAAESELKNMKNFQEPSTL